MTESLVFQINELRTERTELRMVLREAVEWDGHDSEGVEAVWLQRALKVLGETASPPART